MIFTGIASEMQRIDIVANSDVRLVAGAFVLLW